MLDRIADGRTDLVFETLAEGNPAGSSDAGGVSLIQWCAYYGDVSAIKHLLAAGESLDSLGSNLDLNGAVFHGHEQGKQPGVHAHPQGAARQWRRPELRDGRERRDGEFHARCAHPGRDAAPPRGRVWKRRGDRHAARHAVLRQAPDSPGRG